MRFLASFQVSFPVLQVSSYCVLEIVKHSPRSILPREFSLQKDSVVTKISSGWGEHAFDWGRWAGQGILTEILGRRHVPDVPPPLWPCYWWQCCHETRETPLLFPFSLVEDKSLHRAMSSQGPPGLSFFLSFCYGSQSWKPSVLHPCLYRSNTSVYMKDL